MEKQPQAKQIHTNPMPTQINLCVPHHQQGSTNKGRGRKRGGREREKTKNAGKGLLQVASDSRLMATNCCMLSRAADSTRDIDELWHEQANSMCCSCCSCCFPSSSPSISFCFAKYIGHLLRLTAY